MEGLARFLEGMETHGRVIDVFLNASPTVAFIWGPIKFLLQVSDKTDPGIYCEMWVERGSGQNERKTHILNVLTRLSFRQQAHTLCPLKPFLQPTKTSVSICHYYSSTRGFLGVILSWWKSWAVYSRISWSFIPRPFVSSAVPVSTHCLSLNAGPTLPNTLCFSLETSLQIYVERFRCDIQVYPRRLEAAM